MRTWTILVVAAALGLAAAWRGFAETGPRADVTLAQAMTGGAGSNSPAGAGTSPRTEAAPGSVDGGTDGAKRTSKDSGTGNPLAGDEQDDARPGTDPRPEHGAGHDGMPHASPGAR